MPEIPIALAKCPTYEELELSRIIGDLLDKSGICVASGSRILVKPNLLLAKELACSNSLVTCAVCEWLLDHNCKVIVGDSPAFGTAQSVGHAIGLDSGLKKIGLRISPFQKAQPVSLDVEGKKIRVGIAKIALECDQLVSVAKVKAHSQMRLTLCVKNCFGVICGMRKAFLHALYGAEREFFASLLKTIWQALPPVSAVADGIIAMHVTGPSNGMPFPLNLIGASPSAPLLDFAIMRAIQVDESLVPLANLFANINEDVFYPLFAPGQMQVAGFIVPENLKSASFNPVQLARSCIKRFWKNIILKAH